ncbi:NlpC/P60 family protein [Lysinibacter sp. HNR]|uniref:NlpC/P60 family protein n=1 Tax=Lysinibacter sp. HNR TaxID=3031408 RepID=UPI002434B226|nr:NlpC/P60 family protein [Lysinibacter sp. HNR]WGD36982.1 NlpC/P60 family protein [Lysinibacter sp. HNR]
MAFLSRRETTTQIEAPAKKRSWSKSALVRNGVALGLSAGLLGTLALPAYAELPEGQTSIYIPEASLQSLMADSVVVSESFEAQSFEVTTGHQIAAAEQAEKERVAAETAAAEAAANRATAQQRGSTSSPGGATAGCTDASCAAPVSSSTEAFVAAALAQVGRQQDCTALVENAYATVLGRSVGDQSPMQLATGKGVKGRAVPVSEVQRGDVVGRNGHVFIYLGNGQGVHGGWTNGSTVVAGGEISNPLKYTNAFRPDFS